MGNPKIYSGCDPLGSLVAILQARVNSLCPKRWDDTREFSLPPHISSGFCIIREDRQSRIGMENFLSRRG